MTTTEEQGYALYAELREVEDRIEAMATEYRADLNKVLERIAALESSGTKLSGTHYDVHDRVNRLLADLERKVEELEQWRLTPNALTPPGAEHDRQARWHATYNAVMTGLVTRGHIPLCERRELHDTAAGQTDRAHGPLEAKVPVGAGPVTSREAIRDGADAVSALVKAANALEYALEYGGPLFEQRRTLREALKPFEGPSMYDAMDDAHDYAKGIEAKAEAGMSRPTTEIHALVKAARTMVKDMSLEQDGLLACERLLLVALKPFEGVS